MKTEDGKSTDFLQALAIYDSIFPRYQSVEPQIRRLYGCGQLFYLTWLFGICL